MQCQTLEPQTLASSLASIFPGGFGVGYSRGSASCRQTLRDGNSASRFPPNSPINRHKKLKDAPTRRRKLNKRSAPINIIGEDQFLCSKWRTHPRWVKQVRMSGASSGGKVRECFRVHQVAYEKRNHLGHKPEGHFPSIDRLYVEFDQFTIAENPYGEYFAPGIVHFVTPIRHLQCHEVNR